MRRDAKRQRAQRKHKGCNHIQSFRISIDRTEEPMTISSLRPLSLCVSAQSRCAETRGNEGRREQVVLSDGFRIDDPSNSVFEHDDIKINQKPKRLMNDTHVRARLKTVFSDQRVNRFDL